MRRIYFLTSMLMFTLFQINAQMGINKDGSAPHQSAMLDIKASSTTNAKGLLMPRVADHTVITSPATGLMVFNTTTNTFWYFNGLAWTDMGNGGSSGAWLQNGTNVYTNNNNVGINTAIPQTTFDVKGDGFVVSQKTKLTTDDPNLFVQNMPLSNITYSNVSAGILYDPSGPNAPYPSGSINTITYLSLNSSNKVGIKLTFESFDTESNGDSIIIVDGANRTLVRYSGNTLPPDFIFNGVYLGIKFKTNGNSIVGQGFKIKWQAYDRDGVGSSINGIIGNAVYFETTKGSLRSGFMDPSTTPQNTGNYSVAMGYANIASGYASVAMGRTNNASGIGSIAMGTQAKATGSGSLAFGNSVNSTNANSIAMGNGTTASGTNAIVLGAFSYATANSSTSIGFNNGAYADYSTALGSSSVAYGYGATAIGNGTNASGFISTAMGYNTTANGNYSTVMGSNVNANNEGSFVIGDSPNSSSLLYSQNSNSFNSRFRNGYYLFTSATLGTGAVLFGGGNSWSSISDSTKKENFLPISGENVLKKIANMRTVTWNYKGQDPKSFRHYGPMAQEFFSAFGRDKLGVIGNDTTIASADFDGINFTAIKALEKRTSELQTENELLKKRLAILEKSSSEIMVLKAEMEQLKAFLLPEKEKVKVKIALDK